jgi:MFS family permease
MGIASIAGPLIGGGLTSSMTWRWCFYINLPIGAVAMLVIFFLLDIPDRDTTKLPLAKKLLQLDALGTALLVPGVVCLLLALQWGGQMYSVSYVRLHHRATFMSH